MASFSFSSNRTIKLWTCCECRETGISMTIGDCPNCQHARCIDCDVKGHIATDAEVEEENMKIARSTGQLTIGGQTRARFGGSSVPTTQYRATEPPVALLPRLGQRGEKALVIMNFRPYWDNQITVSAGEEITILDEPDEDTLRVRRLRDGVEGMIPRGYIKITTTAASNYDTPSQGSRPVNEYTSHQTQQAAGSGRANQPESSRIQERARLFSMRTGAFTGVTAEAPRMDSRNALGIPDPSTMYSVAWLLPIAFGTEKLPVYVLREDSDAALISTWHDKLPGISRQCSAICKSLVSLHFFRVGCSESSSRPTIIVNTSEALKDDGEFQVQFEISKSLRFEEGWTNVDLSFRTSTLRRSVDSQSSRSMPSLPPVCRPRNCQFTRAPHTGASIGISGSFVDTATLGCYLLVHGKPMVLTVDHLAPMLSKNEVITHISEQDRRDAMVPLLEKELYHLVSLTDHKCEACYDLHSYHPRSMESQTVLALVLDGGRSDCQETCPIFRGLKAVTLPDKTIQYQTQPMARKFAQSGRRSRCIDSEATENGVVREMDWALYEVMRDSMFWPEELLSRPGIKPGSLWENELMVTRNVKPGALVKSVGRTSGYKLGQVNTTESTIFQGEYFTLEWCVLKRSEDEIQEWIGGGIGVDGDSGGLIIDAKDNTVYGMLWGRTGDGPATITIFTPMLEILSDIRERIGLGVLFLQGQQMPKPDGIDPLETVESVPITVRIAEKEQTPSVDEPPPSPGVRRQSSSETGHPRPFERYRGGHATRQRARQTISRSEQDEKSESIQWPGAHTYLRYAVADDQE